MSSNPKNTTWKVFCKRELSQIVPLLKKVGYTLQPEQPHIIGERSILSGEKMVLLGTDSNNKKVVIKVSRNKHFKKEIEQEKQQKLFLKKIDFSHNTLLSPQEIFFGEIKTYIFLITEYIEQDMNFLQRPLEEQFLISLRILESQEGTYIATHKHIKKIKDIYEIYDVDSYLHNQSKYTTTLGDLFSDPAITEPLKLTYILLKKNHHLIERYNGFLTHWDLVPHNIRVRNGQVYLLDHSALRFGNKYDGWARLINFMSLYNPALEKVLTKYVEKNRFPQEATMLKLMRAYRLSELVFFYTQKLPQTTANLKKLTLARINFWITVLNKLLENKPVPDDIRLTYIETRDKLRDKEEIERQKNLH